MRKIFLLFVFCFFSIFVSFVAKAESGCSSNTCPIVQDNLQEKINNSSQEQIFTFFKNIEKLQNNKSLFSLKKFYTDDFVNTDGFNKEQLFDLMERTFKNYPDIKSSFTVKNIILQDDFATVFVEENVIATTKEISKITNDKGEYQANIKNIFYLKKIGDNWKIYSEDVLLETSRLAFGMAKTVNANLNVPQKVLINADYTAGVNVETPEGFSAMASINSTQIVEDFDMQGEVFRQISSENNSLERILKANDLNNNEAVFASLGFTKINQDMFKKKKIDLLGLLILMQRVDIIPHTSNIQFQKDKNDN